MSLLSHIFGCRHEHYSWPRTLGRTRPVYVVCWDCSKELPYDLEQMRITKHSTKQKMEALCALPTIQKY